MIMEDFFECSLIDLTFKNKPVVINTDKKGETVLYFDNGDCSGFTPDNHTTSPGLMPNSSLKHFEK